MKNHLIALIDFSKPELALLVDRAIALKKETAQGKQHFNLAGRTISMLFDKPSTRTRVSFESAMYGLGGQVIHMTSKESQLTRGEPLKDTARVLARYVDAIVVRTFGQNVVEELALYSTVPVINALTDLYHPCQVLSDIMTVVENKGSVDGMKIVWLGDGNNMANSWVEAASVFGFPLTLACPEGYGPDKEILEQSRFRSDHSIVVVHDPNEAVRDADVINVDVWASMGHEDEQDKRQDIFQSYQLNTDLLGLAKSDAIVLHCLPAHRGEEISDEVLEGEQCVAFDQAENKMHIHKAILEHFIK